MQNKVDADARTLAGGEVRNVALDERKIFPSFRTDDFSHILDIAHFASREIVQANNFLVELKE